MIWKKIWEDIWESILGPIVIMFGILAVLSLFAILLMGLFGFIGDVGNGVKERWATYQFNKGLESYQARDYTTALAKFTPLAGDFLGREDYNIESRFYLGLMYDNGWGVPQDDVKAMRWYRYAVDYGNHAGAQASLGEMYEKGDGVPQDNILAYVWYYLAADNGHEKAIKDRDRVESRLSPAQIAEAQYNLGLEYRGEESEKWFRLAAEAGNINVQYELGKSLSDAAEALKWLRLAAEAGHVLAQIKLAEKYGGAEALKWYRRAAEMGDIEAQYNLGEMYKNGDGVPQNYRLAYMWHNVAYTRGHESAEYSLETIADSISSEEVVEAKRMSWQCLKQNYKDCEQLSP